MYIDIILILSDLALIAILIVLLIQAIKKNTRYEATLEECLESVVDIAETQYKYNNQSKDSMMQLINRIAEVRMYEPDIELDEMNETLKHHTRLLEISIKQLKTSDKPGKTTQNGILVQKRDQSRGPVPVTKKYYKKL